MDKSARQEHPPDRPRQLRPREGLSDAPGTIQKAVELLRQGRKSGPFCCFGNDTALTLHRGKGALLDHQELRAPRWPQAHTEGPPVLLSAGPSLALFQEALRVQTEKAQSLFLQKPMLAGRQTCGRTRGFHVFHASAAGAHENGAPDLIEGTVQVTGGPRQHPQVLGQLAHRSPPRSHSIRWEPQPGLSLWVCTTAGG